MAQAPTQTKWRMNGNWIKNPVTGEDHRVRTITSILTALVLVLVLAMPVLAQGGPPAPEPVDQPDDVAALREMYEDLSRE